MQNPTRADIYPFCAEVASRAMIGVFFMSKYSEQFKLPAVNA